MASTPSKARDGSGSRPRRPFLNVKEAAQELRLDESTLYRHLREGRFPGVKVGGRYLVPAAVFMSFGVALLLPTWFSLRPEVIAPSFIGLLALGLLLVSILASERRWPLIPAALLGAVALVDLIGGVAIIPAVAAPFFVPVVLLAVGAYLLVEPQG